MKSVRRFGLESVKAAVVQWRRKFFAEGIRWLVSEWDASVSAHEDYF